MSLLLAPLLVTTVALAPPIQSGRQRFRCGLVSVQPGRVSPRILAATPLAPVAPRGSSSSASTGASAWRVWWSYNQDTYLELHEHRLDSSSLDREATFFLDQDGEPAQLDAGRRDEQIAAALLAVLESDPTPVLEGAALLALGRIGSTAGSAGTSLERMLDAAGDSNRSLAETATLALGLLGGHAAARGLAELLEDSGAGRELAARRTVPDRQRALAAYALALAARDSDRDLVRFAAHHLARVLQRSSSGTHDLEVACALALSLLELESPTRHELAENVTLPASASRAALARSLLERFDGRGTSRTLRARLPAVLARLADGLDEPTREAIASRLLECVELRADEPETVVQGAVVALGRLGDADADPIDVRIRAALMKVRRHGSSATRGRSALALAHVGARPGNGKGAPHEATSEIQDHLVEAVERGPYGDRQWNALALGVLARELEQGFRESVAAGSSSDRVPARAERDLLPTELLDERSPDLAGALAIASGLMRSPRASELLVRKLETTRSDELRGELALAMGLAGDSGSIPALQALLNDSEHRPLLLLQAASALAMLGDETRVPRLLELTRQCDCLLGETSIYQALGLAGDRHAVPVLVRALGDEKSPDDVRAVAATALGRLADPEDLPFSIWLSRELVVEDAPLTLSARDGTGIADLR